MNSLKQAEKPWKQALYIYVNQYNQNRVDYSSGLKEQIVADLNYLVERREAVSPAVVVRGAGGNAA